MEAIRQLSIFIENKFGRLNEVLDILAKGDITVIAATVADTSEYGILRMITSDIDSAIEILKKAHISASISEVVAIESSRDVASFAKTLKMLSQEGVSIEYMYSFSVGDKANLIIRTHNQQRLLSAIERHSIKLISCEQLKSI